MKIKTKITLLVVTVIALSTAFVSRSQAQSNLQRYIVAFEPGQVTNEKAKQALEARGAKVLTKLDLVHAFVVQVPDKAVAVKLATIDGVTLIEEDSVVYALKPPGGCQPWPECKNEPSPTPSPSPTIEPTPTPEPSETIEWGVDRIDAELTWTQSTGQNVDVAVLDTGIDSNHEDLVVNLQGGVNFISNPPWKPADPNKWDDDNGHGTHVAGIIGAAQNGVGVVGVAPNTNLHAVKVLDRNGSGYLSTIIQGIEWAINNDIEVINMSLGTSSDSQTLHNAVDSAYNAGIVIIAAAGNSGDGNPNTNEVNYPAKYSSVVAVGATALDDTAPYWSSTGPEVEVSAPGVSINSAWNDGNYKTISGTSMASPHTAGVAALILSANPNLTPAQVRTVLQTTSDDLGTLGKDTVFGYGLVDAQEAVAP